MVGGDDIAALMEFLVLRAEIAVKQISMQTNGEFSSVLNASEKEEPVMLSAVGRAQFRGRRSEKPIGGNYTQV